MAEATDVQQPPANPAPSQPHKPTHARLPSLNQLAARINPAAQASGTGPSAAPRPRLPTELLRTGSAMSMANSVAGTVDSLSVQASSTRPASPASVSGGTGADVGDPGTPTSTSGKELLPAGLPGGDSEITSEKLERLEKEEGDGVGPLPGATAAATAAAAAPAPAVGMGTKAPRGYKNIPSLDDITERLKRTRTLSVDGSAMPSPGGSGLPGINMEYLSLAHGAPALTEAPEPVEKEPEHPLQHTWSIFHDSKPKAAPNSGGPGGAASSEWTPPPTTESTAYLNQLTLVGSFGTVESFCRYQNWLKPPSRLERNSNYHLFKDGIKPMWEDPANANGGKWVLTMRQNPTLLDRCWSYLCMALVGEELEDGDEICGAVVSLRAKVDRIQLWTRSKTDIERLNAIARKMVKLLDLTEADNVGLEFQYNSDDHPPPNKFISMSSSHPMSGMRATFSQQDTAPPAPGAGGGADTKTGGFGMGGGGAFKWRKG